VAQPVAAVAEVQINDRQDLAEYQATLPIFVAQPVAAVAEVQINDRQDLAEYQATLPIFVPEANWVGPLVESDSDR
jgi:hypothetical protein